jgi:hypothetical protein
VSVSARANGYQKLNSLHRNYLPVNQFVSIIFHCAIISQSFSIWSKVRHQSTIPLQVGATQMQLKVQKDECR